MFTVIQRLNYLLITQTMKGILILCILILTVGCDRQAHEMSTVAPTRALSPTVEQSINQTAIAPTMMPTTFTEDSVTPTTTVIPSCESSLFQVTNQAVEYYFWSRAGDFLYFTYDWPWYIVHEVDWWSYEVDSGAIQKIGVLPKSSPLNLPGYISALVSDFTSSTIDYTSPDGANTYLVKLNLLNSSQSYSVFVSPSGKRVFLAEEIVTIPVPTLDPTQSLEGESSGNPYPVYQDFYYFPEEAETPIFYGRIQGRANRTIWSRDESLAIIEIDMHAPVPPGPAYYWLVDIVEGEITPLFSIEPYSQSSPLVWDISPDNQWILFTFRDDEFFSIRNLDTGFDRQLELRPTGWVRWLDDSRILVAFGSYDEGAPGVSSFSVYVYDIDTQQLIRLLDQEFRVSIGQGNAVTFSLGSDRLAFIEEGSEELFVVTFVSNNWLCREKCSLDGE